MYLNKFEFEGYRRILSTFYVHKVGRANRKYMLMDHYIFFLQGVNDLDRNGLWSCVVDQLLCRS